MQNTDAPPDVTELYTSATHASNLRVEADRNGPADLLIASGWSPSRLGSALLRLHSEYDGVEHPKRGTEIYVHEFTMMLGKLKSLPDVRYQLTMQAEKWQIADAGNVAASVLMWWLDKVCSKCHGVRFEVIPGTPSLSGRLCKRCHGTGEAPLLHLSDARKLANHIEVCVQSARQSIKKRLRPSANGA